jgi:hypothetical protein
MGKIQQKRWLKSYDSTLDYAEACGGTSTANYVRPLNHPRKRRERSIVELDW